MKMKPLHFLAFTVIAGMFFSSCSLNLLSGRHYNLNLVKVEKTQQKSSKKNKEIEIEASQNITASTEHSYSNTIQYNDLNSAFADKNNRIIFNKKTSNCKPKNNVFVQGINNDRFIKKARRIPPSTDIKIDSYGIVSFASAMVALASLFTALSKSFGSSEAMIFGVFFSFCLGILAFITSILALKRINKGKTSGFGFALFGLIIGLIPIVILAIFAFFILFYIATFMRH